MPGFIELETLGLQAALGNLASLPNRMAKAERNTVQRGAVEVIRRVLERINRQRAGLTFKGKFASRRQASYEKRLAAGGASDDFLFVRTGALRASLTKTPTIEGNALVGGLFARVGFRSTGPAAKYAPVHEFGTDRAGRNHNVHIPARAPLRKSLTERRDRIKAILDEEVGKALAATVRE